LRRTAAAISSESKLKIEDVGVRIDTQVEFGAPYATFRVSLSAFENFLS
jgi:hypothetical protein